jgi:hypothetical protein
MSIAPRLNHVRHAFCAAMLALGLICAAGNAFAQTQAAADEEDDEIENSILNADKRMFNAILGSIGLGNSGAPNIEYRERSPLVVPQGRDLPPPGKAVKAGDWPVEPEVKAKRTKAALRKAGKDPDIVDPALPISGTAENYKTGGTGVWADEKAPKKEPDFITMMMQGKLGGTWEEYGKFTGEPARTSLVQPPSGYLTPSPAAPYGMTPREEEARKVVPLPKGQDGDE